MPSQGHTKLHAQDFLGYVRAFNSTNYPAQHAYYTNDVELVLPDPAIPTLKGSSAIMDHYKPIHASADEIVVPIIVMSDRGRLFLQMETYFHYKEEVKRAVHDYHVHAGDVVKIHCCAIYHLDDDGKMKRITCYGFSQELLGQVDIEEKIRESESRADADLRLNNY
ncbi:hypothetical protein NM208_g602 [Fusarium decemcellulare]|uniref:Uncharacterized protein n=1 Tax=Fusarium decemcellulare TaxID=57161 RepID=A0ACC1SZ07_9HYPO|nr:hypothetical protein NM208_g602 [Fusarium decemcellulare]